MNNSIKISKGDFCIGLYIFTICFNLIMQTLAGTNIQNILFIPKEVLYSLTPKISLLLFIIIYSFGLKIITFCTNISLENVFTIPPLLSSICFIVIKYTSDIPALLNSNCFSIFSPKNHLIIAILIPSPIGNLRNL